MEVIVPIHCSCSGEFYHATVMYVVHEPVPFSEIACGVFEGLVKSSVIVEENVSQKNSSHVGSELRVPVKCACPGNDSLISSGINYFLTYPFKSGDEMDKLAMKFGVPLTDVWRANHLNYQSTVFPNTTALVPLKEEPVIATSSFDPSPPVPGFVPTAAVEKSTDRANITKLYIAGSVAGILLIIFGVISCGLYVKALNQLKARKYQSSSYGINSGVSYLSPQTSTPNSCLSPDLLVGIKYSPYKYSIQDLKRATCDFSEDSKIGCCRWLYRGCIDNTEVMIRQLTLEEARWVIDAYARINHINILNLLGICYGERGKTSDSQSFLVFESPGNGCLRDCLTRPQTSLHWDMRKHIAFDIATGLHYLHHCITPPYANVTISSDNVFITADWRAKLGIIGGNDTDCSLSWTSKRSEKAGIYAFGLVLLELILGKAMNDDYTINGKKLRDSLEFLGGGASSNDVYEGGCFEQLRGFIDPSLKDDCPITEALCFVVLAKACVEDDPPHRPSMNDIIKVLARMV
ncbi:hypothetical protein CDL15_Pgr026891 [Punica granatum]|uniref:LysM domain receptor-like kinase 4 n=1 Tax=Punica granatum TaxID=22663 RepID=A0A218WLR0_PUNGR|nr:hypothetical protein CDL15_Pgr026891 [Punica granatum]